MLSHIDSSLRGGQQFISVPTIQLDLLMYQRGDSGQKKIPINSGIAGSIADPSCNLQAIFPVCATAKLAHVPRKIPKAVHNCQDITRAPRIEAGEFSAA